MSTSMSETKRENGAGADVDVDVEVFRSLTCPECGSRDLKAVRTSKVMARIECGLCTAVLHGEPPTSWYWSTGADNVHGPFATEVEARADAACDRITSELAEVERLRAEAKRRSMIFNCVEKELAAQFYGMPLDSFYELSFAQWTDVARHYYAAAAQAGRADAESNGAEVES